MVAIKLRATGALYVAILLRAFVLLPILFLAFYLPAWQEHYFTAMVLPLVAIALWCVWVHPLRAELLLAKRRDRIALAKRLGRLDRGLYDGLD